MINGTIHKRNFGGQEKWYFVEELICDFFIGKAVPNDKYIEEKGKAIRDSEVKEWFEENKVVHGYPLWFSSDESPFEDYTFIDIVEGYLNLI